MRAVVFGAFLLGLANAASAGEPAHAIAMHGQPKYPAGFTHFDFVNPNAPKGGDVVLGAIGTYDSLNPYVLKGVAGAGIGLVHDTLMVNSADEAFTEYGLLAETVQTPEDRSWVAFTLRPQARFHDGSPVTVEDAIYTFDQLKTKGHPFYRAYYHDVAKAEKIGERTVRFTFSGGVNRELPLIVGQLPVLSRAYWTARDFEKTTLEPPLGSGPYRVGAVDAGRSITYRRVADYWGRDLPVRRGRNNFETIRFDYYRDTTVSLEAFKSGAYDFRQENSAKEWATGYDFPAMKQGLVKQEEIVNEVPTGMQGFAFNTRHEIFKDRRVRLAIAHAFDFEWSNKTLFYGAYSRTRSYFSNSELASRGLPSPAELAILEPFRGKVPDEVFTREYEPPKTDGSGNQRENLRVALDLLKDAGWTVNKDRVLVNAQGKPLEFEILLSSPQFERIALPFTKSLERLGIKARVRTVDTAQYQNRTDGFDFDVIVEGFGQSLSPGNEQRDFWGSASAGRPGGRNVIGIKDPVVDQLVDLVIAAPDRQTLIDRTRALDRVLLWGHYVIPHFHIRSWRVAYWDKFSRPATPAKYSLGFSDTWWVDADKAGALQHAKSSQRQ